MITRSSCSRFLQTVCLLIFGSLFGAEVYGQVDDWGLYLNGPGSRNGRVYGLVSDSQSVYAYGAFDGGSMAKISSGGVFQKFYQNNVFVEAMALYDEKLFLVGSPAVDQVPEIVVQDQNGAISWSYQEPGPGQYSGIVVDASGVYVNGYNYIYPETVLMRKFDHSGNLLWSTDLNVGAAFGHGAMVIVAGRIYLKAGLNNLAVLDTNGVVLSNIATSIDISSLFYADNFLYASGDIRDPSNMNQRIGHGLIKMDLAGHQIWENILYPSSGPDFVQGRVGQVLVNAGSIFLSMKGVSGRSNSFIAEFNLDGVRLGEEELGSLNYSLSAPQVTLLGSNLLVGGAEGSLAYIGTAGVGESPELSPAGRVISVGDIDADGFQDIAILANGLDGAPATVDFKTLMSPVEALSQFSLDEISEISDIKVVPDTNGNGASELLVLGVSGLQIELRDSLTGNLLEQVHTGVDFDALKIVPLVSLPGNNSSLYAVFGQRASGGWPHTKLLSVDNLEQQSTVAFNPNFTPRDFTVVDDIDGDQAPELAMLGTDLTTQQSKIEIRSLTGKLVKNIWLGRDFYSRGFVSPASTYTGYTAATGKIAVLQSKTTVDAKRIAVIDAAAGNIEYVVGFNWRYGSSAAVALDDYTGNGYSEFAVLGARVMPNAAGKQPVKVELRDSATASLISNVWQGSKGEVKSVDILPDINGNTAPEIVTLISEDDVLTVYVKDGLTGDLITTLAL